MKETRGQKVSHITKEDLTRIRRYLNKTNNVVLSAYIDIGINAALTFSKLYLLKFEDLDSSYQVKDKEICFNRVCVASIKKLKAYYESLGFDPNKGYIFKNLNNKIDTPCSSGRISKEFKNLREALSLDYPIGTGSLKKTWYHLVFSKYTDEYMSEVYNRVIV